MTFFSSLEVWLGGKLCSIHMPWQCQLNVRLVPRLVSTSISYEGRNFNSECWGQYCRPLFELAQAYLAFLSCSSPNAHYLPLLPRALAM